MTKADALADPRFKGKAKVIREINGKSRDQKKQGVVRSGLSEESNQLDDDELFIDTWEIYDHKNREWLVMAEDADDLLIDPRSLPPGIERDPFAILRFTLRDSSPYPIPPVSPAIDPQKEYRDRKSVV